MRMPILVVVLASLAACGQDAPASAGKGPSAAPLTAGSAGPDGIRRVAIDAGKAGYTPSRIAAKPGEKLVLVFTRTAESACIEEVAVPGHPLTKLPLNTPVELPVTAPATGELKFACGMDMLHGVIVAS